MACVLQDFVPFRAAALLPLTPIHMQSRATGIAEHILPLGDLFHSIVMGMIEMPDESNE